MEHPISRQNNSIPRRNTPETESLLAENFDWQKIDQEIVIMIRNLITHKGLASIYYEEARSTLIREEKEKNQNSKVETEEINPRLILAKMFELLKTQRPEYYSFFKSAILLFENPLFRKCGNSFEEYADVDFPIGEGRFIKIDKILVNQIKLLIIKNPVALSYYSRFKNIFSSEKQAEEENFQRAVLVDRRLLVEKTLMAMRTENANAYQELVSQILDIAPSFEKRDDDVLPKDFGDFVFELKTESVDLIRGMFSNDFNLTDHYQKAKSILSGEFAQNENKEKDDESQPYLRSVKRRDAIVLAYTMMCKNGRSSLSSAKNILFDVLRKRISEMDRELGV